MKNLDKKDILQKRILIVEDDPIHRKLMGEELQRYRLDFAPDSENALARLEGDHLSDYALVIVDLRVPARVGEQAKTDEGFKILEMLQKNSADKPVVLVVSGNLIERTRKKAQEFDVVRRIFEKPFSLLGLKEYVDSLFEPKNGLNLVTNN